MAWSWLLAAVVSALATVVLLGILKTILPAGFLAAGSSARSNHQHPARQIGGLAIVPVAVCILAVSLPVAEWVAPALAIATLFAAGLADDWRPMRAWGRLGIQFAAAIGVLMVGRLAGDLLPFLPSGIALIAAVIFLVWTINMINFMDGLDLMTVSGAGIPLLFLALGLLTSHSAGMPAVMALILAGGLAGFALFNRPPASVFLGDSGSLPIGLAAGLAMLELAGHAGILAALAPFSYYFWYSGLTLLRRLRDGENIFASHSRHAYQRAYRAGSGASAISAKVALASVASGLCMMVAVWSGNGPGQWLAGFIGLLPGLALTLHLDRRARA